MAVDDAALERLRDDLLAAIRAAIRESEHRIRGEIGDAIAASGTRLEARLGARIDASAAETRRHMGVVADDLKSKIALVAEGVVTLTELPPRLRMTTAADNPYGSKAAGSKYQGQRGPTPSRYFENFRPR